MKKVLRFSLIILIGIFSNHGFGQIYVNQAATGSNDGTSWSDAYSNLQTALDNAPMGSQIWIASGIYKPSITGDTADAYFRFYQDIELYGGFNGSETALEQRDWMANRSILSGDHNGDDIDNDFSNNRTDNSLHVMWLTDTISTATIIDGLTFSNGHTLGAESMEDFRRGGGLLTYGAPTIRNCYFTQNYGYFGGGLYPRLVGANDISITNCVFETNRSRSGGAIYINCPSGTIANCVFDDNTAENIGGAVYNNTPDGSIIEDCEFTANRALDSRAGALYNTGTPSVIQRCSFIGNSALSSSGGALQIRNADDNPVYTVQVVDCVFENNRATWGGAIGTYDMNAIGAYINCEFKNNSAVNTGGASTTAFGALTHVENCTFLENTAPTGGAMYSQNDTSKINIIGSYFEENSADRGGAVNISGDNEPFNDAELPLLTCHNSTFVINTAVEQAGAINMNNGNMEMTNSLISFNLVLNVDGIGGGISFNTSDSLDTEFSITNSTIVNNIAFLGAGFATWVLDTTASSVVNLQNTIWSNADGNNYDIEQGISDLISKGGNLSSDNSMATILVGPNDLNATDPLFVDQVADQHLRDNSPCVNAGISAGAPLTDIEGSPRVGQVDMGAYENQNVVAVEDVEKSDFGPLYVYPNPIQSIFTLDITNDWKGEVRIQLLDAQGKEQYRTYLAKNRGRLVQAIRPGDLPRGVYYLVVSNDSHRSIKKLIR